MKQLPYSIAFGLLVSAFGCSSKPEVVQSVGDKTGKPNDKQPAKTEDKPAGKGKVKPDWVNTEELKQAIAAGRLACQKGKFQQAIDLLAELKHPEASYLKAVAFHGQKKHETAFTFADLAHTREPDDPKYKAARLSLALMVESRRKASYANDLVQLGSKHSTTPGVGYFSYLAYELQILRGTKQMLDAKRSKDNDKAAQIAAVLRQLLTSARITLRQTLDLAAGSPELDRLLLTITLREKMPKDALRVAERLRKLSPKDPFLAEKNIQALTQIDPTRVLDQVKVEDLTPATAVRVAQALNRIPASDRTRDLFAKIVRKFPKDRALRIGYAIFLAKDAKPDEAIATMEQGMVYQPDTASKTSMLRGLLGLMAEAGDTTRLAKLMERHLDLLDERTIAYFEARSLTLQKKPLDALKKYGDLLKALQKQQPQNPALQAEVVRRIAMIFQANRQNEAVKKAVKAIDDLKKTVDDATKKPQPEKKKTPPGE